MSALAFEPDARLEAHEPPEARGLARDGVRLLVADRPACTVAHRRFRDLQQLLAPGDLLVVNTSATLPAALLATRADGTALELRLSPAPGRDHEHVWVVELRHGDAPFPTVVDEVLSLPAGATARILAPYAGLRLWLARLDLPQPLREYVNENGHAIRYRYVPRRCRWRRTRTCTPSSPEAPRWRAPVARSRPS